jgi:hypothetical protein
LLNRPDSQMNELRFGREPSKIRSDGIRHVKFAFGGIGEIDFIVAGSLTPSPITRMKIEDALVQIETVSEIITKKAVYRGSHITPRDIFDIAAAGEHDRASITAALRPYGDEVGVALAAVRALNPEFVDEAISNLAITAKYKLLARKAAQRTIEILDAATS